MMPPRTVRWTIALAIMDGASEDAIVATVRLRFGRPPHPAFIKHMRREVERWRRRAGEKET